MDSNLNNNDNSNNNKDFNLELVPVRVINVNFDGLQRTKGDFATSTVGNVFQAKTFGDLIFQVGLAQDKLRNLEIFKEIGVIIDVDRTAKDYKTSEGYDITFVVKEFGRVAASAKTEMGAQADAQLKTGIRMPNLFGRAEKLEVEYAFSSLQEENSQITLTKPFPNILDSSLKTTLLRSKTPNSLASYLHTATGAVFSFLCSAPTKFLMFPSINHKLEYEMTWRELTPGGLHTPYLIRTQCGHSFKSAARHTLSTDSRDRQTFAKRGIYFSLLQEIAGFLGDVRYHKFDLDLQHNLGLPFDLSFQSSFRTGMLTPWDHRHMSCGLTDRFFMGGPYSLRGFDMRGVKIEEGGISLGGMAYWSTAAHLYVPLYYLNRRFPMVDNCRLHFFVNGGNLAEKFSTGNVLRDIRVAYGCGLAVAFGNFGRFELNYCIPMKRSATDKVVQGLQLGVGIHFL